LAPALDIVHCHQERWDGSGYPRNLKGDAIPLGARIFAAVDTFDAMTSDRPYRAALPIHAAREEIRKFSGTQFDPVVAAAFLSIDEGVWLDIRNRVHREALDEAVAARASRA
jgi:HD-GYP domain-containing protein (c-di-GMP phosphodiesterase class II)